MRKIINDLRLEKADLLQELDDMGDQEYDEYDTIRELRDVIAELNREDHISKVEELNIFSKDWIPPREPTMNSATIVFRNPLDVIRLAPPRPPRPHSFCARPTPPPIPPSPKVKLEHPYTGYFKNIPGISIPPLFYAIRHS
ncbi:hypothetical protein PMAYCL1PPCAC_28821, partial [Pristionchus mayeri]